MAETDDELAAQDARYRAICRSAIELLRLSNQLLPDASTREQIKKLVGEATDLCDRCQESWPELYEEVDREGGTETEGMKPRP